MAPVTNWLSFSLSPMEMLRCSESQIMPYESSSAASPHYYVDNFYANGIPIFYLFNLETLSSVWLLRKCEELQPKSVVRLRALTWFSVIYQQSNGALVSDSRSVGEMPQLTPYVHPLRTKNTQNFLGFCLVP